MKKNEEEQLICTNEGIPCGGVRETRLRENIFWLSILQVFNYALPMATVPYLIRVLGASGYGLLSFSLTLMQYLVVLTDYGFNLSATRAVALVKNDRIKLGRLVSAVVIIKTLLLLLSGVILLIYIYASREHRSNWPVLAISFLMVAGSVAFPVWLFQGLQDMRLISILTVVGRVICTAGIFIWVRSPINVSAAALWSTVGYPISGMLAWVIIRKRYNLYLRWPTEIELHEVMRDGFHIFVSSVMSSVLTSGAVLMLGFMEPMQIVGIYAAIEKIAKAATMAFSPITQSLYPRTVEHFAKSFQDGTHYVYSSGIRVAVLAFIASVTLWSSSSFLVRYICGPQYVQHSDILKVLSGWLFLGVINNIFGIQYLLGSGRAKAYSILFSGAAITTLMLLLVMIYMHPYYGPAVAITLGEALLTVGLLVTVIYGKRNNSTLNHDKLVSNT
jgi:PST family polysaccharide transporter